MTTVAIVEDHTLVRQSLVKVVEGEPDLRVVGEASIADEAVELIRSKKPDVVLLDIGLPGGSGLEVAAKVRHIHPEIRILFLTMHEDDETMRQAIKVGDGYIPKTASTDEVVEALKAVASEGSYISPRVTRKVFDMASGRGAAGLTQREVEILRLMASGQRPAEVAESLFLSPKTVKNQLTSIYSKLGVETAAQAVGEAFRLGIVSGSAP